MFPGGEDGLHLAFVIIVHPKSPTVVPLWTLLLDLPFLRLGLLEQRIGRHDAVSPPLRRYPHSQA